MSYRKLTRLFTPCLLLAASSALAGESIDQRLPAAARGSIEVSNVAGTVIVHGTARSEVHVQGEIGSKARLEFSVDGERTIVKIVQQKRSGHDLSADIEIEIPAGSDLTVSTLSADITVAEVRGQLDLQSVSGNLEADAYDEDLKLRTVSGDVDVHGNRGAAAFSVVTVSGNLNVKNAGGEVNASSVSGDLNLHLTKVTRSRLRTTSGEISLYSELAKDARVDSESVSGDINFNFDGPRDAEYDLATATGAITNCFGPQPVSHEYAPGQELKFREGAGSASLRARAMSGDIALCKD